VSDLSDDRAALSRRDLLKSAALAGVAVGTAGLWSPAIAENISAITQPKGYRLAG
jgi:hypothetical protein